MGYLNVCLFYKEIFFNYILCDVKIIKSMLDDLFYLKLEMGCNYVK